MKIYDVTVPQKFIDKNGEERSSYSQVGTAFRHDRDSGSVINVVLAINVMEKSFVLFERKEPQPKDKVNKGNNTDIPDVPF